MAIGTDQEAAVRAALQRVLASKYFAQADSLSNLLRYLVEETLAGRGSAIKELTVGCDVFGRGPSFDPKTDGIVRVQASRLRTKLRDYYAADGQDDDLVISVPAGSYAVQVIPNVKNDAPQAAAPAAAGTPRWLVWAGIAAALAVAAVLIGSLWKPRPEQIKSLAVLPFRNLTGDAAQDYLADGLTDTLITDLGKVPGLQVISRTTAMSYAGTKKSLATVARELKVDALVEGSMTRTEGNIRVNLNLIDVRERERNLWSRTLEHQERDFAGLQEEMNRLLTRQIQPAATLPPPAKAPHPDAYAAYLKGRYLAGPGSEAAIRQAIEWYGKATAIDSQMALAKASQAQSYVLLSDFFVLPADALRLAKLAAVDAVAADPSLAEAYAVRGAAALFYDRDIQAAETDLRKALQMNPNSAEALTFFAVLCGSMGRFEEAIAAARRAVQLDPVSQHSYGWLQWLLIVAERYEEVEQVGLAALQMFPDAPLVNLWVGASHALRGNHQKAVPYFDRAAKFDQIPMVPLMLGLMKALAKDKPGALAQLAKAHSIGKRRYICAYEVATLHSALGEMDEAYRWMEQGLGEKCVCLTWLMVEPWMKAFRADPRFPALAAKVGLWDKVRSF